MAIIKLKFITKTAIITVLFFSFLSLNKTPGIENTAKACYPAIKCYTWKLPKDYKFMYSNKDRSAGAYLGAVAIGAAGLVNGGGVPAFAVASAIGFKETFYANKSYKVYLKKSPVKGKTQRIKTVYYKKVNFKGKKTTKIIDQ